MSKKPDAGGGSGGESDNDGFELYRIRTLPENYGTLLICYYDATNRLPITEITEGSMLVIFFVANNLKIHCLSAV